MTLKRQNCHSVAMLWQPVGPPGCPTDTFESLKSGSDGGSRNPLASAVRQPQAGHGATQGGCEAHRNDPTNEPSGIALIKADEFSFELSWKTLKDLLTCSGVDVGLPREVLKQAFAFELITVGQIWIDMLEQRNRMAHTYDQRRAEQAMALICDTFWPACNSCRLTLRRASGRIRGVGVLHDRGANSSESALSLIHI